MLVWDDLGKSKHTESREEMYYEIINERYKRKAPIILVQMKMNIPYLKKLGSVAGIARDGK